MKKLLTLLVLVCSASLFAQTSGITYQAVILNPEGQHIPGYNNQRSPVVNKNICMRFTIHTGTNAEYQETQQTTTDEFGMVNLIIGTGSPAGGSAATFGDIIWDGNPKNLKVEVSLTGICSSFLEISDQPLTAVPYALYAANSGTAGSQGEDGNLTLVNTTTEAAGTNCATGGVKLEFGVDINRNGTLEPEEIATGLTKYVCNGAAGPQGSAGSAGPAGPAGPQGVAGAAGAQGAQGLQGVPGPAGAAGEQGPQGTAGINGLSAYQVAVANGYVGTEQQWLTSIQGGAGTNGQSAYQVAVANGYTGTQTEWLASLVGAQGPQGPAGSGSGSIGANAAFSDAVMTYYNPLSGQTSREFVFSSNGKHIVFGSFSYGITDNSGQTIATQVGRVYVMKYENGNFANIGSEILGSGAGYKLGFWTGISGDGQTIFASHGNSGSDGLLIYKFVNNDWLYSSTITGYANNQMKSPKMTDDGNTIICYESNTSGNAVIVHIYKFNGSTWNHTQFTAMGIINNAYGFEISPDGSTIAISHPYMNGNTYVSNGLGLTNGRTAIFKYNGASWALAGTYIEGTNNLNYGANIALSNDGLKIAITSSTNTNSGGNLLAPVYVRTYNLINNIWEVYGNDIQFNFLGYSGFINFLNFNPTSDEILVAVNNSYTVGTNVYTDYFTTFKLNNNNWNQIGSRVDLLDTYGFDGSYGFESNVFIYNQNNFLKVKDYN